MPNRTSDDVRWIIVHMHHMRCHYSFIAMALRVSERTVREILGQWRATGSVQTVAATGAVIGRPRALDFEAASYLRERVANSPTAYLDEIQADLFETLGVDVHVSTISRSLKHYGITRKKLTPQARERSKDLREQYRLITSNIAPECFVCVDESGIDSRTTNRSMGYSPQGERASADVTFVRGDHYSILPALCLDGVLAMDVADGAFTAKTFREFIQKLLTRMNPYPQKNSVIIMDNCRIHKDPETIEMIAAHGMHYVFLPPYSPDYNPIELAFAKIKKSIARDGDRARMDMDKQSNDGKAAALSMLFKHVYLITPEDARGWFHHCHYI